MTWTMPAEFAPQERILMAFPRVGNTLSDDAASADEARDLRHGKRLLGAAARLDRVPAAAIDPSGAMVGVVERRGDDVKSVMNLPEEASR